jgi:hypothetical protein
MQLAYNSVGGCLNVKLKFRSTYVWYFVNKKTIDIKIECSTDVPTDHNNFIIGDLLP